MSRDLELRARQSVFLVREGATKRKLTFPSGWNSPAFSTADQLIKELRAAEAQRQLVVVVLNERDFPATQKTVQETVGTHGLGVTLLVVSEAPDAFLKKHEDAPEIFDVLTESALRGSLKFHLQRAIRDLVRKSKRESRRINQEMLERLNQIFITLSAERDQQKLLAMILAEAIDLTGAEIGTLYTVEERDGEMYLKMKIANDGSNEVVIQNLNEKATENNICGYVVLTGKPLNIPIHEGLKLNLPLQFQRPTPGQAEAAPKSVIAMPLKNSDGEILAVLELLNKKGSLTQGENAPIPVDSFDAEDESLIASFIAQAAICLENVKLYGDISSLFDGFVKASITAIESRDPSTGGHSERVANMTVALARATSETTTGIYRSVRFKPEEVRELEYAALLHDFGKIGVREEVLVKAKKLYPFQLEAVKERIKLAKEAIRLNFLERKLHSKSMSAEREYQKRIEQIDGYWQIITAANEPTILRQENFEALEEILRDGVKLSDGYELKFLTLDDFKALSVPKGSLTEGERLEVESHVRHTYQFLKMIPWTKDFRNLPDIAHAHHEKLDGSGYPRGLVSHEIPLQSKIMTIADIYDALTAADRWYKEAVPTEKALDILAQEVSAGQLDPVLFEIFVEKRIYELNHAATPKRKLG